MRSNRISLAGVALLLAAIPASAAHMYTVNWSVTQETTIGGSVIKPGSYELRIEEGQTSLQVVSHGKMVVEVPCKWVQLPSKAAASEVEVDSNKVTTVEFSGKTAALDLK
jgi:hypothetical protein